MIPHWDELLRSRLHRLNFLDCSDRTCLANGETLTNIADILLRHLDSKWNLNEKYYDNVIRKLEVFNNGMMCTFKASPDRTSTDRGSVQSTQGLLGSIVLKLYYFWYQLWSGFLVVKLRISLVTLTPIFNALSHFMKSNCKVHSIFNFILCLPVLYLRAN